jgi:DNA-binding CsgD family transcriptional regulator
MKAVQRTPTNGGASQTPGQIERGRDCYQRHAWAAAFEELSRADRAGTLAGEDLERLATAAYLIGRDKDYLALLERAYQAHAGAGATLAAARAAFWLGLRLLFRGESGRANGWFARARRLLERQAHPCVEQGYVLLATTQLKIQAGELDAATHSAESAIEIGERFAEADLIAVARHLLGRIRLVQGDVGQGLELLDEAMLSVTGGELSPIVTGLIYCSVIEGCQEVYAVERAQEWTAALAKWCEQQPEMIAFTGVCRVHRAEILQLRGAWSEALAEARCALDRCLEVNQQAAAAAFYQLAELQRLRGDFRAAEAAYENASRAGLEPQPGLALLRLAERRVDAAAAAMRRVIVSGSEWSRRARLLPAYVEIMLACGDMESARSACDELEQIAARLSGSALRAAAAHARGAVELAEGDARGASGTLRRASQLWQDIDAPYMAARVRVLVGVSCRALGDEEGAGLELAAARAVFARLGAVPDIARLDELTARRVSALPHGLTRRELVVLRSLAAGKTNRAIAAELCLSEKSIERHVSHIFMKLDVGSRTAATAFAYEHRLV